MLTQEQDSESTHSDHLESDHGKVIQHLRQNLQAIGSPRICPFHKLLDPVDGADIIGRLSSLSLSADDHDSTLIRAEGGAEPTSPLPISGLSHKPSWVTAIKKKNTGKNHQEKSMLPTVL